MCKKPLDIEDKETFHLVLFKYLRYLQVICGKIIIGKDNIERDKRKFEEIKKELYDYLNIHKTFFEVYYDKNKYNPHPLKFKYSGTCEEFLSLDEFKKYNKLVAKIPHKFRYFTLDVECNEKNIANRIRNVLGKYNITDKDVQKIFETKYLVTKDELKTKFPNYRELASYIDRRRKNYVKSIVSTERIIQMSFKFKGSLETLNDEKSCGVCLEDYEKGQQICRMPCNHFCCRKCAEQMFKVPKNRSKAHFQCPICRHDCT